MVLKALKHLLMENAEIFHMQCLNKARKISEAENFTTVAN